MRLFLLLIIFLLETSGATLLAQCPNRDSLWKRMTFLQDAGTNDHTAELKELLGYEKRMISCSYKIDSVYVLLLSRISAMYYLSTNYQDAIFYAKKVTQIINENQNNTAIRKEDIVKSYYYQAIFYDSLKMVQQKNDAADSCIAYEKKFNTDYRFTSFLLVFKVRELFLKGDYNLCAEYAALGEALIKQYYHRNDSLSVVMNFINYRAISLYSLGKFSEVESFLQSRQTQFLARHNMFCIGRIYSITGYLYKFKADYTNAINYFKKACNANLQTADKDIAADVLRQLGIIYAEKLNQPAIGLQYFNEARKYAKGFEAFSIFGTIAKEFSREKKFDSAYNYYQEAFNSIKPGANENDLLLHMDNYGFNNSIEWILNVVLDKADTYLDDYTLNKKESNLFKALKIYKVADRLLNNAMTGQVELASRLFWRNYARSLYQHAVEASYLTKNIADAFYFFEKNRAVVLNDQLKEQQWTNGNEFLKLAQIKKKIFLKNAEMIPMPSDSHKLVELQQQQYQNKKELSEQEELIKERHIMYYQGIIDSDFISLPVVQKKLQSGNQSLLEIFSGDSTVFTLLISSQNVLFNRIDKIEFDKKIKSYVSTISDIDLLNSHFAGFRKVSAELYSLIFHDKQLPAGRIIISPDVEYFPFECLIADNNRSSPIYFLNDHAVSYTYSARYLMNDFISTNANTAGNFMGLAPVSFLPTMQLSSLAGSDVSLNKIGINFHVPYIFTNADATKSNFEQHFSDYKIIQLYTHAADSSARNEPVIYFADSALYLSELIPEKKPLTQLVVLSACETGTGKHYAGEGVFSFNRGFAALGVPSSVTNLWSIDNISTYKLTELFYKYLSKNLPLDIALQKAKLEYISSSEGENSLPYYWAAPILVGKTDAIVTDKPFAWKYLLAGICAASIIFLGWMKYKKRKQITPAQDTIQTAA